MKQAGYSGAPLVKKLGIKGGAKLFPVNAPEGYLEWLEPLPDDLNVLSRAGKEIDVVHVFVLRRKDLGTRLVKMLDAIRPDGMIWVSWHKKASKIPTEITEDVVRELAIPLGLVDVKVCAVTDIWSGLKLMIRKELR